MAFRNSFLITGVIGFVWLILLQCVQSAPVIAGDIGIGVYHAGLIGTQAGQQSAAEALNNLYYSTNTHKSDESHDFSEGAAKNNPSLYESLGCLGDHLEGQQFPHDYGAAEGEEKAVEYEEAEAQVAASQTHEAQETHADYDHGHELQIAQENEVDFGGDDLHSHDLDDFYSKPVPGIDHGKGAYSYSTTYEFKDPKP